MEDNKNIQTNENSEVQEKSDDKYMRLYADFDNYKRRVQKEKEDIKNNTKVSMISSILDLDSDISIAIKNIKDEESRKGVQLIASKLEKFLNTQGIEVIQTEKYDSDLHEVISVIEVGEEKIVDVISKGYMLSGKPFRFPKIILGK
jgi:molecular chaperone GrpE